LTHGKLHVEQLAPHDLPSFGKVASTR
jgi:hypothetical protein